MKIVVSGCPPPLPRAKTSAAAQLAPPFRAAGPDPGAQVPVVEADPEQEGEGELERQVEQVLGQP